MSRGKEQPQNFLRITEATRPSVVSTVNKTLHGMGLQGFTQSEQRAPLSAEVSRGFGIGKGVRLSEAGKVARAMETMGEQAGTSLSTSNWQIEVMHRDKRGNERAKKLARWPFGWEHRVHKAHKHNVKDARRDMSFAVKTDVASTVLGKNPARAALKRESQEARLLQEADKSATVNGWQGWRARLIATLAEGNPVRVAKHFLQPGRSRVETYGELHSMMLQVADEQLDPADRIHGPFEEGVRALQKFQRGVGGAVLTSIAGDIPLFNKVTSTMIDANKMASRDSRAELTARGLGRVGRRLFVIDKYGTFYGNRAKNLFWRLALPADSLVEQAADRRMQRGNIAKLAKAEAIIRGNDWWVPMERAHQRVVSEEFVRAYNAPAPQLEVLTHLGFSNIGGMAEQMTQLGKDVAGKAEALLPQFLRRQQKTAGKSVDPRGALKQAIESYGGKPMSVREQSEALLAHADAVLALQDLKPIERARWERAKIYAQRFESLNEAAQGIIDKEQSSSRRIS